MRIITACSLFIAAGCALAADPSLHIAEAEGKKAAIEKPAPVYPVTARQLKLKGEVKVEAIVTDAGAVSDVRIVSGNPVLTKPAVEAVKKWRFRPFQEQGKPAAAIVALSFEFDTN